VYKVQAGECQANVQQAASLLLIIERETGRHTVESVYVLVRVALHNQQGWQPVVLFLFSGIQMIMWFALVQGAASRTSQNHIAFCDLIGHFFWRRSPFFQITVTRFALLILNGAVRLSFFKLRTSLYSFLQHLWPFQQKKRYD